MKRLLLSAFAIVALAFLGTPANAAGANHVPLVTSDGPCGFIVGHKARTDVQMDACLLYILAMKTQHPNAVVVNLGGSGRGPAGLSGSNGAKGDTGATGPQGPAGADGKDGKDGVNGSDGKDGADGATGPQGPAGADGADGKDGKDGVCIGICVTVPHH